MEMPFKVPGALREEAGTSSLRSLSQQLWVLGEGDSGFPGSFRSQIITSIPQLAEQCLWKEIPISNARFSC